MRFAPVVALLATSSVAAADGPADLAHRMEELRSPRAVAVTLSLDLHQERTLHHRTEKSDASLHIDVDQDASGLRVLWQPGDLVDADSEARAHDLAPDSVTPQREALKELDPARLAHLLDQTGTVAGLTKGSPEEAREEAYEGRPARRLVYRFAPRLSWTEANYLHHSEGRFTIWIATDGTPLGSESIASFDGKTSRMFGRFTASTSVRTRYADDGSRLRVAERDVDEMTSHEDGGDVERTTQHFVLVPR